MISNHEEYLATLKNVTEWAYQYYVKGNSPVTDYEYDRTVEQLNDWETMTERPHPASPANGSGWNNNKANLLGYGHGETGV